MPPPREINYRLKITGDSASAKAAVDSLDKGLTSLAEKATKAMNSFKTAGKTGGNSGFEVDGAEGLMRAGKQGEADAKKQSEASNAASLGLKNLAFKAAAAVAAFNTFAAVAGGASVAYYQGKSTASIMSEGLKSTPIVGAAYGELLGSVNKTMYGKSMADLSINERHRNYSHEMKSIYTPMDIMTDSGKLSREQARIRAGTGMYGTANRAGNLAQYGEQFHESITSAENNLMRAQRERGIAMGQKNAAVDSSLNRSGDVSVFKKLRDDAANDVKNATSGAGELAARAKLSEAENALTSALEKAKAAAESQARSAMDLIAKQKDAMQAETALMMAKRDRAKALYEESKSGGASFMAGTQEDKYMLAASLHQLKTEGMGSLAPEQLQQLLGNGLTGEYTKKHLVNGAMDDPLLNSILETTGRGSLRDQQRQVNEMDAAIDAKVRFDEAQLEEAFRKALAEAGLTLESIAKMMADAAAREVDNRLNQQNISSGIGAR